MTVQIRVGADGTFREAFLAEAGGGGWFAEGLVAFGSTWGWADVSITGLTANGEAIPVLGAPGKPVRIENNHTVTRKLADGTRQVTVEGKVENPPTADDPGTRPWAGWIGRPAFATQVAETSLAAETSPAAEAAQAAEAALATGQ